VNLEGISGTRNRDFREQLHFGGKRTSDRIYRKAVILDIVKRIAGSPSGFKKGGTGHCGGFCSPPKGKETAHRVEAGKSRSTGHSR
jgi:hypothetical protein